MSDSEISSSEKIRLAWGALPAGPLLLAAYDEFLSSPILWNVFASVHRLVACLLVAYFDDGAPFTTQQLELGESSLESLAPRGRDAFRAYFQAARKVNLLFVIPPLFLVVLLVALDSVSDLMLKSKFMRSFWRLSYSRIAEQFGDPRWIRDYTLDVRPLLLTWACLVPPIGITLVILNTIQTMWRSVRRNETSSLRVIGSSGLDQEKLFRESHSENEQGQLNPLDPQAWQGCLVLKQNVDVTRERPKEFYNSTWFNPAIALPYVLGVPAAITLWIYFNLGIDALLGFPSNDPKFHTVFVLIGLYIYGLASCLTVLFMRSYFTFCWNFTSAEFDIEIYPDRIKALPVKGWFLDFLSLASRRQPAQLLWKDVVSVKFSTASLTFDNTKRDSEALVALRKLATFYESLAKKMEIHTDYLEIKNSFGRSIQIRLWELSASEKLKVFEALRKYCPSVYLDEAVQKALVGSSVMREPQYTEIWFAVLTGNQDKQADGQLAAGQELNNKAYKIASTIASGGQAVLYEAKDARDRTVVLKEFQLTPGESFDAKIESAKDFENESAILRQLSHDGIVKMLDMFYERGRVYIALEHVAGVTLRQLISESAPLNQDRILELTKQMCEILTYLHSQEPPVVHRDFTPDNIILQPDGTIKLIDFSVAQRKLRKSSNNSADCAGKHSYTPPEQFAGVACPQSDVYALGATLYFLATGEDPTPITQSRLSEKLAASMPAINNLIEKCTKLELSERYESCRWILNDIQT